MSKNVNSRTKNAQLIEKSRLIIKYVLYNEFIRRRLYKHEPHGIKLCLWWFLYSFWYSVLPRYRKDDDKYMF